MTLVSDLPVLLAVGLSVFVMEIRFSALPVCLGVSYINDFSVKGGYIT